jgi:hypothetical protein
MAAVAGGTLIGIAVSAVVFSIHIRLIMFMTIDALKTFIILRIGMTCDT